MSLKFTPGPPKAGFVVPPLKAVTPPEIGDTVPPLRHGTPPLARPPVLSPKGRNAIPTAKPPAPAAGPATKIDPAPEAKPSDKIQAFYKQLCYAAVDLNAVSDDLGKPIKVCEGALKKLNLGVAAWVDISGGGDEPNWWDRGVGYTRLKDGWGIALRTRSGNYNYPDDMSEELWAFSEAPRWLRIEGVGKLPDLLGALLKQAEDTTRKLRAKVAQANELADAITIVADELAALERK